MTQEPKYDFQNGRVINRATGEAIPLDEPVIVFRGRDRHAAEALFAYMKLLKNPEHIHAVSLRLADFGTFAVNHPERMKEPDTEPWWESKPMTTTAQADRELIEAIINDYHTTRLTSDPVPHILSKPRTQKALAAHREAAFEEGAKAMSAKDVAAICCAWLDADDATHWGAFEKALDAVVRPLDPAQIAGGKP